MQVGQSCQTSRVVQSWQRGWVWVPEMMGAVCPQEQHRAVWCWQSGHHGRPVIRDVPQGLSLPQLEQVVIGWTDQVQPGDIVVAGKNFGIGSSRPVAVLFTELGVAGLVAAEFNSLFFRNAVNAGLPVMTVPEATKLFSDGDTATFDLTEGTWRNDTTGASGSVPKLPDLILDIIASGGVLPRLAAQGYLPAELADVLRSSAVQISGAGSGA